MILVGNVQGKVAILVDDMIDTGTTLTLAARTLHEKGAKSVHALISHGMRLPGSMIIFAGLISLFQACSPRQI